MWMHFVSFICNSVDKFHDYLQLNSSNLSIILTLTIFPLYIADNYFWSVVATICYINRVIENCSSTVSFYYDLLGINDYLLISICSMYI